MSEATETRPKLIWRWLRVILSAVISLAIIGASVYAVILINQTEPTAEKLNATRKSSALVETVSVQRGTYAPRLSVLGTVQAAREITLSPRVGGQVIELSPEFVPGGMVRKGDLLLKIDPADYENAVSIRKSELAQAEASREIELAKQRLAEKELKMLEGSIGENNRALVMREPQIASIEAEVSAAEAAVKRAQLDLDRTQVFAPFDAQVLTRSINVGSQVRPGDDLSRLVGVDEYWVMASVPVRSLRWIEFPERVDSISEGDDPAMTRTSFSQSPQTENADQDRELETQGDSNFGSRVLLRDKDSWGPEVQREARVSRMIGTLDQRTRLARVMIIVDDPLGQQSAAPPLILDTLIETEIVGRPIENVVRLQREYVRDRDTVWVMKDDQLEIRETEIVFRDATYAYIRTGLETGDEVVTTTLATVAAGIGLRKVEPASEEAE